MSEWKMITIGTGPGPKNVLGENNRTGERVVFTYRNWRKLMAAGDIYAPVQGFVAFDPEDRDLPSGKTVRNVVVNSFETGELVRLTLWPEYEDLDVQKGDLVFAEGKLTTRDVEQEDGDTKTYTNISVNKIVAIPAFEPKEPEVVEPTPRRRRRSAS